MPETKTGTQVDSLLLRATYTTWRHEVKAEDMLLILRVAEQAVPRYAAHHQLAMLQSMLARPRKAEGLRQVSEALLGLHEFMRVVQAVACKTTAPPNVSEEGRQFLEEEGRYRGPGYEVVSLNMGSPLAVVLEIPPEAVALFGFSLLLLAERIATSQTRVSKRRSRDLRDKAAYDRERQLIEEGRLDMAIRLLREYPTPDVIEIVGGDEDFEDAEPVEPPHLGPSSG